MMAQGLHPVPAVMILSLLPERTDVWQKIELWWKKQQFAPFAVRSSAFGEDSEEMSFAGQNQTFLNLKGMDELKVAVSACFDSVKREASQSYRQIFTAENKEVPRNVVLQVMVNAKYAGVYLPSNPVNSEEGALLENIEGVGH